MPTAWNGHEEVRDDGKLPPAVPIAHAVPTSRRPLDDEELAKLAAGFTGKTIGQKYVGPAWVGNDGIACVVFIAADERLPVRLRDEGRCAAIAWRWNGAPSMPLSLTILLKRGNPRPHTRWMRSSDDPVVSAIRREGRFYMSAVSPAGQRSGWYEARFVGEKSEPSREALERQWSFPRPGIPHSNTHARFDPLRRERFNEDGADEIPLWADALADHWKVLDYKGPWADDLQPQDKAMAAWGNQAWRNRGTAAGFVQVIVERQQLDGVPPIVDADGMWVKPGPSQEGAIALVKTAPVLGRWLAGMAGPEPNAQVAYMAAFNALHDAHALHCIVSMLIGVVLDSEDDALIAATTATLEAALLDARITQCGTLRPWFANSSAGLELKTMPINLDAPLADVEHLWRNGFSMIDLIDIGLRIGPNDFPVLADRISTVLKRVAIEGSVEDAEAKVQILLHEAQEARQWSIPWGARVEVAFGPFVAVRIFELNGEFSCHFLDDQERYFHVAIGLRDRPPAATTGHILRLRDDDGLPAWNEDAEVSLKLIAAAIVRDFVVVEERESLFTVRPMRRRVRGHDIRTVIYLPRVRYAAPNPQRMPTDEAMSGRVRHQVAAHLRRAGVASAAQRFLAQRYGMQLPEGFTFVRPHERGTAAEEARVRIYRSRSASRMLFEKLATAPEGARPAWFEFEKDCAQLLKARGMEVIHQSAHRDGDGGVDLYAVDAGAQSWVVQCKCWAPSRSVGPEIVRELEGAIRLADKGGASASRGMIITTSKFTSGAVGAAVDLGFELIDGVRFSNLLTRS